RQYMLWFQEPGVAEAFMDPRAEVVFRKLLRGGVDPSIVMQLAFADGKLNMNPFLGIDDMEPMGEAIVTGDELQHYVDEFSRTGFRGGINWYRNLDRNRELHPRIGTFDPGVPCLMITAAWDPALPPAFAAGMVDL